MKILIVDDSIMAQRNMAKLMHEVIPEAELYTEKNGQDGYRCYCEIKPDLVLLDLLMPGVNGFELLGRIKEHQHKSLVIIVSADIQKSVREEVIGLGAMDFVPKPFNREKALHIAEQIRKWCNYAY